LFVNTEYEREYLIAQGIDRAKIHVTGVGIDIEKVIQPKRQEPVDPVIFKKLAGKKFVLYLGRKEVGKGVEALVSAMEKVNRIFPEVQLVLAGHRSKHFDMKIAPKLAGKKEVNEIEKISESTKQWLFQNASLYCMVSNVDSFGIVYLEAWLNKKPVIGADTGAMRCVITDGQDGLLVPYGDAERLAEQIVYLLQNPDIAGRMGETGCEKVMKKFGNHAVEQKTYDLVHNILTQGT
jgi:glycosyltransferase involved in cell wall biosynthesis